MSSNLAKRPPAQDRRKLAMMGGLAVILAAVMMRTFSSGPEVAAAAPEVASAATPSSAGNNGNGPRVAVAPLPKVIDWPGKVARDPFASAVVYRPPPPPPKPDEPAPLPPPAPAPVVDVAKEAADAIPLTATVVGEKPIAMINGRIYRVGEFVAGFRITEIHARRIVVERNNQRIAIDVAP
jgi:hypothetical protein